MGETENSDLNVSGAGVFRTSRFLASCLKLNHWTVAINACEFCYRVLTCFPFAYRNTDLEKRKTLDLHGLHVDEAIAALDRIIPQKENGECTDSSVVSFKSYCSYNTLVDF